MDYAVFSRLLRPDARVLALFVVFVFICIGGVIQTYAFVDEVPGVVKPPLYDQLQVLELWYPWILLSAPVHFLGGALRLWWLLNVFPELSPGFKIPLASIAFSYALSWWTFYSWDEWFKQRVRKVIALSLSLIASLMLYPAPLFIACWWGQHGSALLGVFLALS